jgi:hypothetical protein
MRILLLAAAIHNAIVVPPVQAETMTLGDSYWTRTRSFLVADNNVPVDLKNIVVGSRSFLTSTGKFGTPCIRFSTNDLYRLWNSPMNLGFGDFTIETFVKFDQVTNENQYICDLGNNGFTLRYYSTNNICVTVGETVHLSSPSKPVPGQWYHVAVVRQNGLMKLFIDGVMVSQGTPNLNISQTTNTWGNFGGGGGYNLFGSLDQSRIVGAAVYSANFTPPQEPFRRGGEYEAPYDSEWSNVVFLTNASADGLPVNASPVLGTISASGGATVTANGSIFGGGTMNTDGVNGVFKVENTNSQFNMGSGDFTVEFHIKSNVLQSGVKTLVGRKSSSDNGGWWIGLNSNRIQFGYSNGPTSLTLSSLVASSELQPGAWYHASISRVGIYMHLAINGTKIATATVNSLVFKDSALPLSIGATSSSTEAFNGSISHLRITKGVGRYYHNFTPRINSKYPERAPTEAEGTYPEDFGLHNGRSNMFLSFTSSTIGAYVNESPSTTGSSVTIDNVNTLFDKPTLKLTPGSTSVGSLSYPVNRPLLAHGDFTVEAWVKVSYTSNTSGLTIAAQWVTSTAGTWMLGVRNGLLTFWHHTTTIQYVSGTTNINDNAWHHVAATKKNGVITLFVDGKVEATFSHTSSFNNTTNFTIGANAGMAPLSGGTANYADVHVISGKSLYNGPFTPRTVRHPTATIVM